MNVKEMRQMEYAELLVAREQLQKEAWQIRFQYHTGAEASCAKIRQTKKVVARINTLIRERELAAEKKN